jgi:hypothetical protein
VPLVGSNVCGRRSCMWLMNSSVMCLLQVEVSALVHRLWNIFGEIIVFAVVFLKCQSLYLNEREKCYGRQIYALNPHKMVKKCDICHI